MKSTRDRTARQLEATHTDRDGDEKAVRAWTERAARLDVGQPVRLDREVARGWDGEALESNER